MLSSQQGGIMSTFVDPVSGFACTTPSAWSYDSGTWNSYYDANWRRCPDYDGYHGLSLAMSTSTLSLPRAGYQPELDGSTQLQRQPKFEMSEDAPEFVPPPPGLGVSDGCSFTGVQSADGRAVSDLLLPPGLRPPPGLEDIVGMDICGMATVASPGSLSTAADSFGEDLRSIHSASSDEDVQPSQVTSPLSEFFPAKPPGSWQQDFTTPTVRLHPREMQIDREIEGEVSVHWPANGRKLFGDDQQIVSSCFELFPEVMFKLMIKAKPKGIAKGLSSFKKARGCGSIELKIIEGADKVPPFRFCLSIGTGEKKVHARGPVQHTFINSAVCGLPREEEDWDFRAATDEATNTFMVSLQVLV